MIAFCTVFISAASFLPAISSNLGIDFGFIGATRVFEVVSHA